jgi:alanine racemase
LSPECGLDLEIVAGNARAWRAYAGVPIRAVLKSDGYNWGAARMARALEGLCDAVCVADADEFFALRPATSLPIVVLGSIDPSRLAGVLDANGRPTIGSPEELAIATRWAAANGRRLELRVGILPAAGWSGLDLPALAELAEPLAQSGAAIEVWTHLTGSHAAAGQIARLGEGVALLRRAGADVTSIETASTFSAADRSGPGDAARIGIGLFGATGGPIVPGVRSAIRLTAEAVRVESYPAGAGIGYGSHVFDVPVRVATLRCGYADGYPKDAVGLDDILSVGMQYTMIAAGAVAPGSSVCLLDGSTNLDALAAKAGRSVHEIVTTLGAAARNLEER